MTGIRIKLSGVRVKNGKVESVPSYRDASHAIRAKKSRKQRVVKRVPG